MEMFTIKKCFNCSNKNVDLDLIEQKLQQVIRENQFNDRLAARLDTSRPMHHQMFHLALAGCPNACSMPQIKDFGIIGQVRPTMGPNCLYCGLCAKVCPDGAITIADEDVIINRDLCLNCGKCVRACPTGALQIESAGCQVLAGGKLGRRPRLATAMIEMANEDEVADALALCVEFLIQEGKREERFGGLMERTGYAVVPGINDHIDPKA